MKKKLIIVLIVLLVLLLGLIGGGIYAGYRISNSPLNLPNVYVGDIAVGKLDAKQTTEALNNKGWKARATTPLSVTTIGGQSFTVDPVKAGYTLSVKEAAEKAYQYGHDGNLVENLFTYLKALMSSVEINALHAEPQTKFLEDRLSEGLGLVDSYMGEAEYVADYEGSALRMKKGWNQIELDKTAFLAAMDAALTKGETELNFVQLTAEPTIPDFNAIHKELEKDPVDASYTDDGKFDVIDEVVGCRFDVAAAEKLWTDAQPGEEIAVPMDVTWPEVTGEFLRGQLYRDLLGAVTTKYPNSAEPRRSNLRLATSKLDGMILYPGDEFSFNDTIGKRTEEAGFLPAPAYVDGDVTDEVGGGVCQVSSTLYAATVFAFLETVERECHYFPVNYMQMGSDATVTIPNGGRSIDFKFRNNKNFPIKIVGSCNNDESTITFEIWGTLEETDYMPVKFDNSYGWQFDYAREIKPAYEGRDGYTIKLTHETWNGTDDVGLYYRTLTHRQVFDAEGNMVADEIINMKRENGQYAMDTYYQH